MLRNGILSAAEKRKANSRKALKANTCITFEFMKGPKKYRKIAISIAKLDWGLCVLSYARERATQS